jgi:hypothetical protein
LALVRSGRSDEVDLVTITQDMALLEGAWAVDLAAQPRTLLAECLLVQGRVEEGLQQAEAVASYAEQHGLKPEYLWALEVQVRALLRLDRADHALTLANAAVLLAAEMSAPSLVWRVQAVRGEALTALGEAQEATRIYAAAAAVIQALAGTIPDSALKEGFLASPKVATVLARAPAEEHARYTSSRVRHGRGSPQAP